MNGVANVNLEEAATITQEFISNLDNLPNEVQHLLTEIRNKDSRSQEIQQEIQKETTRYIRHALKSTARENSIGAGGGGGGKENSGSVVGANGSASANGSKEPKDRDREQKDREKDAQIPGRVAAYYAEQEQLGLEKIELAKRLTLVLAKVNARLEYDLAKVITLSGEAPPGADGLSQPHVEVKGGYVVSVPVPMPLPGASGAAANGVAVPGSNMNGLVLGTGIGGGASGSGMQLQTGGASLSTGRSSNAIEKMMEGLLQAAGAGKSDMGGGPLVSVGATGTASSSSAYKRRRLNTGTAGSSQQQQGRGRGQRGHGHGHGHGRRRGTSVEEAEEGEEEAEGEEEEMEGGDQEDKTLYCYCHSVSYGEMIGCDNEECEYQWFHLECIGLKPPLPERWYCDACIKKVGGASASQSQSEGRGRKGRRK